MTLENIAQRIHFQLDNLQYFINAFMPETYKEEPYLVHKDTGEVWEPYEQRKWQPNWNLLKR